MNKGTRDCFVFLSLLSLIISGCSSSVPETTIANPTTPPISPTASPTPIVSTPFPGFLQSVHSIRGQITDGKLLLTARALESDCHQFQSYETWNMDVEFSFQNMTDLELEIPTRFMVTRSGIFQSDINPLWYSHNNSYIKLFYWDDIPARPYQHSVKIPAGESFEKIINIPLPDFRSGTFIVKFLFASRAEEAYPNLWTGIVGSNPLEVCLLH